MSRIDSAVGRFIAGASALTGSVVAGQAASGVGALVPSGPACLGILGIVAAFAGGKAIYSGVKADADGQNVKEIRLWVEMLVKQHGSLVKALAGLPDDANLPQGVALDRIRTMSQVFDGGIDGVQERLIQHADFESFVERSMVAMEENDSEFRVALSGLIDMAIEQKQISKEQVALLNGLNAAVQDIRTQQQRDSAKIDLIVDSLLSQIAQKDSEIGSLKRELKSAIEAKAEAERKAGRSVDAMLEELRRGHPQQLLEFLDHQVEDDEADLIQRHRERAAVAFVTGDIARATDSLNKILVLRPGDLDAVNRLGRIAHFRGDLVAAEDACRTLAQSSDQKVAAAGAGNLGIVLATRGKLDDAEAMYRKALEINKRLGYSADMASNYGNLGNLLLMRGDLDGAEAMHRKSLEINERFGRLEDMASNYGNIGIVLATRDNLDGAEAMYRKALEIGERLGRPASMADSYGNLGIVLKRRGDLDNAEAMCRKSLEINKRLGRLEGVANNYSNLGNVLAQRGDLIGAREHWTRARDLFQQIGVRHMVEQVQSWIDALPDKPPSPPA